MVELNLFIFKIAKFYKIVNYSKQSIIILLVNCLRNWLIFQIRHFCIESSNVERPGFRNFKITNIEITKDKLFFCLGIYFFIF